MTNKRIFLGKFLFILAITLLPQATYAGIFSFLSGTVNRTTEASTGLYSYNSQNMTLLQAAVNYDPQAARGGGGIVVVGGVALLAETGPLGTIADIEDQELTSDQISIYVVRGGDSLSQIAKMFNVTTNTLVWANDIKRGDLITPGQTLVILPVSGVSHTVLKGETIKSIVKKYKGDLDEVLVYNDLILASKISIGDVIVIPDGEIKTPVYSASGTVVRGAHSPTYSGYYIRPINGGSKTQGLHGYNGVDLGAPTGTSIYASANGTVIISKNSGWNGGYGKYVVVRHGNGTQTLYAHNSRNIVSIGQYVVRGQVIGYVGSTGRSTGPHIHFEIRGAKNPF